MSRSIRATVLCAVLCSLAPAAALAQETAQLTASHAGLNPVLNRAVNGAVRNFAAHMPVAAPPVAEGVNAAATAPDAGRTQRQTLANQLMDLDGTRASTADMAKKIAPLINMALQAEPSIRSLPMADQSKISEFMADEFQTYFIPKLLVIVADYYADQFTADELQTLVTAFQTPTMQKYVTVRNTLSSDLDARAEALTQETAMRAVQRYVAWKKQNP